MSIDKLLLAATIASFGAPVAFTVFFGVFLVFSVQSFTFQKAIEENLIGLLATSLGVAWLVSLFLTMTLTSVIYLLANLFSRRAINIGLVSFVYVTGFIIFAISRMDFRDAPDLGTPSLLIGLAAANALIFMFLAYKWSKKSELSLQIT